MIQNCQNCKIQYDSEGHELIDWLTLVTRKEERDKK